MCILVAKSMFPKINWELEHEGLAISELMVLSSFAGYYWGRCYADVGFLAPFMRESASYYKSEEAALAQKDSFPIRVCMENDSLYEKGVIKHPMVSRVRGSK